MTRTVVITGATSGIGKATAALAEARGWQPIRVGSTGGDVRADLATSRGRAALVEGVTALVGDRLDAVIACVGLLSPTPLTLQVNYFGAIATLEGLRPLLAKGDSPRAVGLSSFSSILSPDYELVESCLSGDDAVTLRIAQSKAQAITPTQAMAYYYSASKAAFCRWIRRQAITPDWVRTGILLNGVAAGMVVTRMTQATLDNPTARATLERDMPMPIGRNADPEEIAELLLWLASPANSMIVGQIIFSDGGAEATRRGDTQW